MRLTTPFVVAAVLIGCLCFAQTAAPPKADKLYNTAKQKLLEGKQVFSFTQSKADPAAYCEYAKHYDYTWFEMQHSTLEYKDIEAMIAACPTAPATPMIRLPDAQEFHIQHATDIGVLGVIVPTVDDVDRARAAAQWARYPPYGRRSAGSGQAMSIWGKFGNYRKTIDSNMLVAVMIETPTGVANAFDIAIIPGIDVVLSAKLSNFVTWRPVAAPETAPQAMHAAFMPPRAARVPGLPACPATCRAVPTPLR